MLLHDGTLSIATGLGARSKTWKNEKLKWSDLILRLKEPRVTGETLKQFISATKEEQLKIKDVGGYVGGYLRNGRRKVENVVFRQLLTLDIDFAHKDFWYDFLFDFENAAVLHSTHKHHTASPRYRLLIPLSRECSPDEYAAIARQIAGTLGIELFDKTTFETHRLMFWPSVPKDIEYYFEEQDGPWLDADEILASYMDWTDMSLWPTADKEIQEVKSSVKKQEDPEAKKGIVGAFCRTYGITEAIDTFLSEEYIETTLEDRYTYTKGSTAAGLIVYEDKFAYSHHGTDPCSMKLTNAFDLVRLHKFGHLDDSTAPAGSKPKSFAAMEELARSDKAVKKIIASENLQEAKYDFAEEMEDEESLDEKSAEWMADLEVDGKGNYLSIAKNLNTIFGNDYRLKKLFRQNDFDGKRYVFGSLPWRRVSKPEPVKNVDYSGIRNYIEVFYGIAGAMKIEDSIALEFEKNHYHPVLDYLKSLMWDGQKRVDTVLIDYFGAEDTIYNREAYRKAMLGAVARVHQPGVKFDLALTLVSKEGTGKSSFLKALGGQWYSDSFQTVQGKEAYEQLQGAWIIEMAELSGLKKADVESSKHFMSKQEDTFRPAYGRTAETYPRQCIFVGTTNVEDFLKSTSGNRRFMPVRIHDVKLAQNLKLQELLADRHEIDQMWAEAVHAYKTKEQLYLSFEAETIATEQQHKHSESDERKGIIEEYLNARLPKNWDDLDTYERRNFFNDPLSADGECFRNYVCVAEVWCECLGRNKEDMDRYKTREINEILRGLHGWEQINSTRNFKIYGKQKYYVRTLD